MLAAGRTAARVPLAMASDALPPPLTPPRLLRRCGDATPRAYSISRNSSSFNSSPSCRFNACQHAMKRYTHRVLATTLI